MRSARNRGVAAGSGELSLLAHLVHDLKNPLGIVLGYAEAMSLADASEQPELCARLALNARALLEVLDEYSLLADLRRNRVGLEPRECDWRMLAERVLNEARQTAQERDQQISCGADDVGMVYADPQRLEQVIRLLVREALRSMPRGARLLLAAQPVDGAVELRLEVAVPPVEPSLEPPPALQVFDAHRPAVELARRLIALHAGALSLTAEPGRGVATIRLPPNTTGRPARRIGQASG